MGWIENLSSHLKKLMLIEHEMDKMSNDMDVLKSAMTDHEKRLIRIETIIEMGLRTGGNNRID